MGRGKYKECYCVPSIYIGWLDKVLGYSCWIETACSAVDMSSLVDGPQNRGSPSIPKANFERASCWPIYRKTIYSETLWNPERKNQYYIYVLCRVDGKSGYSVMWPSINESGGI